MKADQGRADAGADIGDGAERHHLAALGPQLQRPQPLGLHPRLGLRLDEDLEDAAALAELADIGRADIGAERVRGGAEGNAQRLGLGAVDRELHLWCLGAEGVPRRLEAVLKERCAWACPCTGLGMLAVWNWRNPARVTPRLWRSWSMRRTIPPTFTGVRHSAASWPGPLSNELMRGGLEKRRKRLGQTANGRL